jgi:hypothetical protein
MLKVIRSYVPFLLWVLVAVYSLSPSFARAAEDDPIHAKLRAARTLVEDCRWAELARLKLPAAGSKDWDSRPGAEAELLFARGLGAANAGYNAMAWHSVERLQTLRERALAERLAEALRDASYLNR